MDIFIYEDERVFDTVDRNGKDIKLKLIKPNQKDISDADLRYKTKFAQALRDKVMTRAQAEKLIRENQILDQDSLIRRDQISNKLSVLRGGLLSLKDREKGLRVIKEINELRDELENINNLTLDIMNQTAEAYAEEFRLQWLACVLTRTEDDEKYYEDYEDFNKSMSEQATLDIVKNLILFINNLKDNFELEFGENQWLMEQDIIKEDGSINVDLFLTKNDKTEKTKVEKKSIKKNTKKSAKKKTAKKKLLKKKYK